MQPTGRGGPNPLRREPPPRPSRGSVNLCGRWPDDRLPYECASRSTANRIPNRRTPQMRRQLLFAFITLMVASPSEATAQVARSDTLYLRFVEASTGRPLLRTWLNHWGRGQAGNTRYLGQSRGDAGGVHGLVRTSGSSLEVMCQRADGVYGGRAVASGFRQSLASWTLVTLPPSRLTRRGATSRCWKKGGSGWGTTRLASSSAPSSGAATQTRTIWVEYGTGAQARSPLTGQTTRPIPSRNTSGSRSKVGSSGRSRMGTSACRNIN